MQNIICNIIINVIFFHTGLQEENVRKYNTILQNIKEIQNVTTNSRSHKVQADLIVDSVEETVDKENLNNFFPLNDGNALEALEEKLEDKVSQEDLVHKYFCTICILRLGSDFYKT